MGKNSMDSVSCPWGTFFHYLEVSSLSLGESLFLLPCTVPRSTILEDLSIILHGHNRYGHFGGTTFWRLQRFNSTLSLGVCLETWGLISQGEQSETINNHKDLYKLWSKSYDLPPSLEMWLALAQVYSFCWAFLWVSRRNSIQKHKNINFSIFSPETTAHIYFPKEQ